MYTKKIYEKYIYENNRKGSNKAASYIRALELLNQILSKSSTIYSTPVDFWSINSISEIENLYKNALKFQKKENSEFLQEGMPQSYGKNGYYSAALKSYKEFLIIHRYETKMWKYFQKQNSPEEITKQLASEKIEYVEKLLENDNIGLSLKEGKEALHYVKTRINQAFFRKMILYEYNNQCAITGLNISEVLRASHIIPWSEDKNNRLNPSNGLCLSATYDAAFDRYLISFDKDYRMILSSELKEHYANQAFKDYFKSKEGLKITLPKRFLPNEKFLEKHREKLK